jgi:polyketide biosynthesis enoyl-CoA hydratase PksH
MTYQTICVRIQQPICFIQFCRPDIGNVISEELIADCNEALRGCDQSISIVVLEGSPDVFCSGADFQSFGNPTRSQTHEYDPEPLYQLWETLCNGPYITIAHVRGRANAGGVGFVAASDIVLANQTAQFSLSELLFGLMPACVLPFLIRRVGFQRAHYMTLTTQPVSVQQAHSWGLVDDWNPQSEPLLHKLLLRLRRISKRAIVRYKAYGSQLDESIHKLMPAALIANREVFLDDHNISAISRYVKKGLFPWEE